VDFCERSNEPSGGVFLDQLNDCSISKKDCAVRS
jgi:hypothetical protein